MTEWLLSKGIRQWLQPFPLEIYRERQEQGENYGLFVDDELAAVVSLIDYRPDYWEEYLPETPLQVAGDAGVVAASFKGQSWAK